MAGPHNLQNRTRSPLVITFAACGCLIAVGVTGIMVAVAAVIINMPKAANPPSPTSSASTSSFSPSASADETSLPPASPTPGVPQPTPGRPSTNTGDNTDDTINARLPDTVGEWDLAHIGTRPIYARGENTISILITDIADGKATAENPSWGLEGEKVFDRGVCAPHPDGRGGFMCWVWPKDLPDTVFSVQSRDASMEEIIKVAEAVRG
ncbi:hypothetical protein [Dermabacter hominis]|uniref:hypothetical protein n=1 Tax=Dermabacter hominis TaxID=36740 RepID=UPI00117B3A00|nr:hypothetical protein CYJ49_010270 [Dermabacter hominis]